MLCCFFNGVLWHARTHCRLTLGMRVCQPPLLFTELAEYFSFNQAGSQGSGCLMHHEAGGLT